MGRFGVLFPLLAMALVLSGCMHPAPAHVRDWEAEATDHGPMGLRSEFDLSGAPFHVTGEGSVATFGAPFWIAPSVPGWAGTPPYVYLETHLAGDGPGVVRIEGTQVRVVGGSVSGLRVEAVEGWSASLRLAPLADPAHEKPQIAWGEADSNLSSDLFHARATPVTGTALQMDSFERAVFYGLNGTPRELSAPLTLDVTSIDLLPQSLIVFQNQHLNITYGRFAWAAASTAGALTTEKGEGVPRPSAVFGSEATLEVAAGRVKTTTPFRLTQAIGPSGPLLPADVEVRVRDEPVEVPQGETRWVAVDYRERGYEGAGILKRVQVTGAGAAFVDLPVERPPLFVEQLWERVPRTDAWARPFAAALAVLASPAVLWLDIVQGVTCVFATCPEQHPYPAWMPPGEVGTFYVKVDASDAEPGRYEAAVVVEGANHEPVSFPLAFQVVASDPPA